MISILQLRYFCALAKNPNLTKCAEDLYISQSTLSNALARLEADLEVSLFDRVGRNLVLNQYGQMYLQHVEEALQMLDKGKRELIRRSHIQDKTLMVYTISPLFFSDAIDRFAQTNSHYDVTQREFLFSDISLIDSMDPATSVIIAGSGDIHNSNWERYEFRQDSLCALVSNTNRLAEREYLEFDEIKGEPLILDEYRTSFRAFADKVFKSKKIKPRIEGEANYSLLAEAVRRRPMAIGITTSLTAEWYKKADYISHIPIRGIDAQRGFSIYWRRGYQLSDAARDFMEFVKECRGQ